jgi:class 3 adenylate cyclase/tetratricopeptide (TPR) repeat protein
MAAVLVADVVGYAGLMAEDEEGTLQRIKALRQHILEPGIDTHRGRMVKTTGDGFLAEFPSPVEAVRCAVEIQAALSSAVAHDAASSLQVRIGINLCDIIIEEDGDIYGDGVNVAARLQELASPGGIFVSAKFYDEVQNKVPFAFESRGEQRFRNIATPVLVYAVAAERPSQRSAPRAGESAPTIAVLPFHNAGDDEAQRYFSDGFTQDVITELSRFTQIGVVSWSTVSQFRGENARSAAGRLNVQFVLEATMRRMGARLRIGCELFETSTGVNIWAERFDRSEEEIFAIQDQLVRVIAATLVGRVQAAGSERAARKPPKNLAAYECVLRGNALPLGDARAEAEARRWYERAIEIDPAYGRAYSKLAHYVQLEWLRDMREGEELLDRALDLAKQGVALSRNDPVCLNIIGWIYLHRREFDVAERYYDRALTLNPNDPEQIAYLGTLNTFLGKPDQALSYLQQARALDQFYDPPWFSPFQGMAHYIAGRYEAAISALTQSSTMPYWVKAYLAASYARLENTLEARRHANSLMREMPDFSAGSFAAKEPYRDTAHRSALEEGLRASGLPG